MKMVLILSVFFSALTMSSNEDSMTGQWNTGQENTVVEITEKDGVYSGHIIATDKDPSKVGTELVRGVKNEKGKWKGEVYAVKKKKWLNGTFKLEGDKLLVTVKSGPMKKTLEWHRK